MPTRQQGTGSAMGEPTKDMTAGPKDQDQGPDDVGKPLKEPRKSGDEAPTPDQMASDFFGRYGNISVGAQLSAFYQYAQARNLSSAQVAMLRDNLYRKYRIPI